MPRPGPNVQILLDIRSICNLYLVLLAYIHSKGPFTHSVSLSFTQSVSQSAPHTRKPPAPPSRRQANTCRIRCYNLVYALAFGCAQKSCSLDASLVHHPATHTPTHQPSTHTYLHTHKFHSNANFSHSVFQHSALNVKNPQLHDVSGAVSVCVTV